MDLRTSNLLSILGTAGVENEFYDLVALVRDAPRTPGKISNDASGILPSDLLPVKSFSLYPEQVSTDGTRYAGEGADPATFGLGPATITGTFKMPLFAPVIGWVDPSFARIWELCRLGWKGTGTSYTGLLIADVSQGDTVLTTDNTGEFAGMDSPFPLTLTGGGAPDETVTVTSIDKRARTLTLSTPTTLGRAAGAILAAYPGADNPLCDPCFSLWSLSEGLAAPCIVNRLTIDVNAEQEVSLSVEVKSLALWRDRQIPFRTSAGALMASRSRLLMPRTIHGFEAALLPQASEITGTFGLPSIVGQVLLAGYEHLNLTGTMLKGFSITIDNKLNPVYSLSSEDSQPGAQAENSLPWAFVSSGRTVTGTLTCLSPLQPWTVAERIAGLSNQQGGGITLQVGTCRIPLADVAWKPGKAERSIDSDTTRILEWTLVSGSAQSALPSLLAALPNTS